MFWHTQFVPNAPFLYPLKTFIPLFIVCDLKLNFWEKMSSKKTKFYEYYEYYSPVFR